jgi:membrane protease YdiL (CAAX protease family)
VEVRDHDRGAGSGSAIVRRQLRWSDAAVGLGLGIVGEVLAGVAAREHWLPAIVAAYASHAWLAAIALAWYFWLGRRFPVGNLSRRELIPWYVLWLLAVAGTALQAFISPPPAVHIPAPGLLAANLVFLALVVGPSEELLFRGLVQTGVNGSVAGELHLLGWPLRAGTVLAAACFGLSHLVNLTYQPLGITAAQVLIATGIGLVIGVVYDRTRNLIGAAVLHSLLDFSGYSLPLLAYAAINH